ncbi:hypothetical protein KAU11_12365 [Candidatus Babeliales bacterium]|nr:hypothetical protein [Candidatus Babeliales bacterium]
MTQPRPKPAINYADYDLSKKEDFKALAKIAETMDDDWLKKETISLFARPGHNGSTPDQVTTIQYALTTALQKKQNTSSLNADTLRITTPTIEYFPI